MNDTIEFSTLRVKVEALKKVLLTPRITAAAIDEPPPHYLAARLERLRQGLSPDFEVLHLLPLLNEKTRLENPFANRHHRRLADLLQNHLSERAPDFQLYLSKEVEMIRLLQPDAFVMQQPLAVLMASGARFRASILAMSARMIDRLRIALWEATIEASTFESISKSKKSSYPNQNTIK